MSLYCKACHRILEKQAAVCPHDSFSLKKVNVEFPPYMGIEDLSLQFESCTVPGEHIRFYKTVEKGSNAQLMLQTYASSSINQDEFNGFLSKMVQFEHTNVCKSIKYGALDSGINYIISESPSGHSISDLMDKHGEIEAGLVIHVFNQLLDALIALNHIGLIHGNLMPINCFVLDDPQIPNKLRLSGLSLPVSCFTDAEAAQYSEVLSPLYLSPERIEGASGNASSEIYSVGALMYEALTGLPPYTGKTIEELHQKHFAEQLLPLRGVAPELDIPGMVESIVLRALNRNPAGRFATLEDMQKELLYAAKESRIYLPTNASSNYNPGVFTPQAQAPPEIHKEEKDLEEIEKEAEQEKIKQEEEKVEKEIETKVKGLKSSFAMLAVVVLVLIVGGGTILLSSGSDEDKAPMYVKLEWEESMSQGDSALKDKNYAEAILKYKGALETASGIEDDNEKKVKTLEKLFKAYEGHGDKAKAKEVKQQMIKIEEAHLKEVENE